MGDDEIARVGQLFGAKVPDELEMFLRTGVPISNAWAPWRDGAEAVFDWTQDWIQRAFAFDIEQGAYWHPLLGERPFGAR